MFSITEYSNSLIGSAVLLIVFIVCVLLYSTILIVWRCYILRRFRGTVPLPFIGNLYEAGSINLIRHFGKLRKRHGKVFTFFIFSKAYLVVMDPIIIRRILSDSKIFIKGVDYTKSFAVGFGTGLVTSNGEKHKHDRGIFGRFFIRSSVAKFLGVANALAKEAVEEKIEEMHNIATVVDIEKFFATLALRTFGRFSMNVDFKGDKKKEEHLCHIVSKGSLAVGEIAAIGLPNWDIFPQVKFVKGIRNFIEDELKGHISERKELISQSKAPDDCLTAMIKENMNGEEMTDHIVTLLCAGHDTTAFFCSYLTLLLAKNSAVQEKVYDELMAVIGDRGEVTAEDTVQLNYFNKVMQETLRLYSVIPQLSRLSTAEVHIKEANITIPKDINIFIPLSLVNRDPDLWENPSEFVPERFDGKASSDFTSAKNGFFPFGYGSRTCIGNTLAQLETFTFFYHFLKRFKIEHKEGFKPNILSGISLTTSNGIDVILSPR